MCRREGNSRGALENREQQREENQPLALGLWLLAKRATATTVKELASHGGACDANLDAESGQGNQGQLLSYGLVERYISLDAPLLASHASVVAAQDPPGSVIGSEDGKVSFPV